MSQDERESSDDVGTVGEEAAKLLGALSGWAKDHGGDGHIDTGAPECTYCPICKTVHVLRQASPEVRTHLATAGAALLQAFAGLMATPVPGERTSGVQNIDLDDDSADWPEDTDTEDTEDSGEGDR
ncbi:hypothetical protein [Nocardioides sp. SR21]|uniref:hypothetical protein n=1 Tax=Nocardioides sp. SR21 TaxID=2919501 RepID=UPI001FA9E34B|nr:hypothetical protein [Nocardioides sp. SR21]